jgi:hypothetical protein
VCNKSTEPTLVSVHNAEACVKDAEERAWFVNKIEEPWPAMPDGITPNSPITADSDIADLRAACAFYGLETFGTKEQLFDNLLVNDSYRRARLERAVRYLASTVPSPTCDPRPSFAQLVQAELASQRHWVMICTSVGV